MNEEEIKDLKPLTQAEFFQLIPGDKLVRLEDSTNFRIGTVVTVLHRNERSIYLDHPSSITLNGRWKTGPYSSNLYAKYVKPLTEDEMYLRDLSK